MSDNVSRLSPSAKAIKQAKSWLDKRRAQGAQARAQRAEFMEAITGRIQDLMSPLGIKSVNVGDHQFIRPESVKQPPSVSSHWSNHLASGGQATVIEVNTAGTGYYDQESVDPEQRTLADLVDADMIARLAPTATIYGPGQETPWATVLPKSGFQVWVIDPAELEALWKHIPNWVLTAWHDDTLRHGKHPFTFNQVAGIWLTRIEAPDMDWRISRLDRSRRQLEQHEELGAWDAQAQADIKRAMGALVGLEGHPVFGQQSVQWVEQMLPALAYSMEGKKRIQQMEKDQHAAWDHATSAIKSSHTEFKNWSPVFPNW